MSRIEKALEKAVEMRKSVKEVSVETDTSAKHVPFSGFGKADCIINADMVDKHIVCITDFHAVAAEQYKKLRARVLRATVGQSHNTIVITSPEVGEGKTVTAINLAVALAHEIDHTVLLVDADLKHPSVHKYLGIENGFGLTDCLLGRKNIQDVLIKTGIGNLVILTAGNSSDNPSELLSSDTMRQLVYEMKHRYKDRYIIIDTPPILMTAESLALAGYADGVLLIIEAGRTTPATASSALSHITGSNVLGVVLNNMPKYFGRRSYQQYYSYGIKGYHESQKNAQKK